MTIKVGDQVGFYKQLSTNEHKLQFLRGTVVKFINSNTVEVRTKAGTFSVSYSTLMKDRYENL